MQTTNQSYRPTFFPQQYPAYSSPQYTPPRLPVNGIFAGKTITNESEILPSDVPMDGTIALFPMQDYSRIFAKQWTRNGTIETVVYTPETVTQPIEQKEDEFDRFTQLSEHIDAKLDEVLNALSTKSAPKSKTVYRKSEGGDSNG